MSETLPNAAWLVLGGVQILLLLVLLWRRPRTDPGEQAHRQQLDAQPGQG